MVTVSGVFQMLPFLYTYPFGFQIAHWCVDTSVSIMLSTVRVVFITATTSTLQSPCQRVKSMLMTKMSLIVLVTNS